MEKPRKDPRTEFEEFISIDTRVLERFQILERIGQGAFGVVWRARDRRSKELLALKKIHGAFRNKFDAKSAYREINFLQALGGHPNIVRLYSIHRASNDLDIYLGFEYMETDLHNIIRKGNILDDIHKKYIMYQVFCATRYMHSGNVIHRDYKPSNILLDKYCRVKVADFGLARSLTTAMNSAGQMELHTKLTTYVGSRWYRAPEILTDNRIYSKGADIWSLGCIMGEMLQGRVLFKGTNTASQVKKILAAMTVPSQEELNNVKKERLRERPLICQLQEFPEDVRDLMMKLLALNPEDRITAEEAMAHKYVNTSKFERIGDMVMPFKVTTSIDDRFQFALEDYRDDLYAFINSASNCTSAASSAKFTSGACTRYRPYSSTESFILNMESPSILPEPDIEAITITKPRNSPDKDEVKYEPKLENITKRIARKRSRSEVHTQPVQTAIQPKWAEEPDVTYCTQFVKKEPEVPKRVSRKRSRSKINTASVRTVVEPTDLNTKPNHSKAQSKDLVKQEAVNKPVTRKASKSKVRTKSVQPAVETVQDVKPNKAHSKNTQGPEHVTKEVTQKGSGSKTSGESVQKSSCHHHHHRHHHRSRGHAVKTQNSDQTPKQRTKKKPNEKPHTVASESKICIDREAGTSGVHKARDPPRDAHRVQGSVSAENHNADHRRGNIKKAPTLEVSQDHGDYLDNKRAASEPEAIDNDPANKAPKEPKKRNYGIGFKRISEAFSRITSAACKRSE